MNFSCDVRGVDAKQESTEARFLTEAEAEPILGFRDRG